MAALTLEPTQNKVAALIHSDDAGTISAWFDCTNPWYAAYKIAIESDAVGSGRGMIERNIERNRLIVETAYALWEAGDIRSMTNCFSDNVAFAVHPPSSTSFLGQGHGKAVLKRRLERFLSEYQVVDYQTVGMTVRADWIDCRICYHYRHRKTRMEIDGRMRHLWRVLGGKIVRLDIIHDARRMGAFFDLAAGSAPVQ